MRPHTSSGLGILPLDYGPRYDYLDVFLNFFTATACVEKEETLYEASRSPQPTPFYPLGLQGFPYRPFLIGIIIPVRKFL